MRATAKAGAQCVVARYDALVADPGSEIAHVCAAVGLRWDRPIDGPLPLANHTVSPPQAEKWCRRETELALQLARLAPTIERATAFAAR